MKIEAWSDFREDSSAWRIALKELFIYNVSTFFTLKQNNCHDGILLKNRMFWMVLQWKSIRIFMIVLHYLVSQFAYAVFVNNMVLMKISSFAKFEMRYVCDFKWQISSLLIGSWKAFKHVWPPKVSWDFWNIIFVPVNKFTQDYNFV